MTNLPKVMDNGKWKGPESDEESLPKITRIKNYLSARYEFRYNNVANEVEYRIKDKNTFIPLNPDDLHIELYEHRYSGFGDMLQSLMKSKFVPTYDPFQTYFESLPSWTPDQPDYITELANYVQTTDQPRFIQQFKKALVRTAACALGYLPFNKHCIVLTGEQHDGKTYFIRFLVPPTLNEYIKENPIFESKDAYIDLTCNFIINLDEMSNFPKTDINKIKAFLTVDKVKIRRPYDRKDSVTQRRASFFGSTNQREILTDDTGNVRWLVFQVLSVNHDQGGPNGYQQRINIDLVWAQVYSLLKSKFDCQLTREEIVQSERNNKRHQKTFAELELIERYFRVPTDDQIEAEELTATEVLLRLRELTQGGLRMNEINVGKALRLLGFTPFDKRKGQGYPVQVYRIIQAGKGYFI
ncbi:VapE domain-containing protein [Larkinella bovis]|uniref:VapE domain-containing protein n=1 Tax=Larkinella bovis TaxID=683041 RepID=A0ABW0I979_9BACT